MFNVSASKSLTSNNRGKWIDGGAEDTDTGTNHDDGNSDNGVITGSDHNRHENSMRQRQ